MFGLITFSGRLGRLGWVMWLAFTIGALVGMVMIADAALRTGAVPLGLGRGDLERAIMVALGVLALSLLGAAVRRLRDAGSPNAIVELLISALIPGFGWLWLMFRLFLGKEKEQAEDAPKQTLPWGRTTSKSGPAPRREQKKVAEPEMSEAYQKTAATPQHPVVDRRRKLGSIAPNRAQATVTRG